MLSSRVPGPIRPGRATFRAPSSSKALSNGKAATIGRGSSARRLFLEPLEPRALLAALAVPVNSAIFDTSSAAPHAEAANLLAELAAQGHTAATFSDLSASGFSSALATAEAVVIPEQELGSLNGALSAAARTELAQFVSGGRGMIVLGSPSGRAESLLNGLFGFSLAAGPDPAGVSLRQDEQSVGTAFATGPFAIFNNITEVKAFDVSAESLANLPAGTKLPYQEGSVAPVGLFSFGEGQIVYLGYDFDDPSGQANAAAWKTLLGAAIEQVAVAAATPTASVELLGGDLVIADLGANNDAFTLSADSQQWTITIESGSFADASIGGVTVAGNAVTIDKALAGSFTGSFVFHGGGGNDVLRVTLDDLSRDVHFDGGETAGEDDRLEVVSNGGIGSLTSAPDMTGGGTIDVASDGDVEIFYSGLEPVDLTGVQAEELHFHVPAGITTAQLIDYLAPNDNLSLLSFGGAGPEDQFFRHPSQLLAIHTAGSSLVTLLALDLTTTVPQLLLDGTATDRFLLGSTHGILGGTSLTLMGATLDLNGHSPLIDGLAGDGTIINSADATAILTVGASGSGGTFNGLISDGWPPSDPPPATRRTGLTKVGAGTLVLTSDNTFSGPLDVQAGTLIVEGSLSPHSQVTVQAGATFLAAGSPASIFGTPGDDTLLLRRPAGGGDTQLEFSLNGGPFVPLGTVDSLAIDLGAGEDRVTLQGATAVAGDLDIVAERIEIGGALSVGGALDLTSHGLLTIDAPVTAQGPVTLTTTDEPGLDADLAIQAGVSSLLAGVVLNAADHAIIRGPISAATTIAIAIDAASTDPEGNTLFLQAPLIAPGGTTATGNAEADRFEIEPQTGSALLIQGSLPAASSPSAEQNATSGDAAGDTLVLDMTTAGDAQAVLGPVIVDSVGGRVTAQNTQPITYRGIEDLDLLDGGTLTTAQQGDLYVRGTDLDERIVVTHDGGSAPRLRVSVQGRAFPGNLGYFGPYVRGRSVIVYARGGRDIVDLSSTPMRGEFHGESGDDYLASGSFGDLLIGGPGGDTLLGGSQGGGDELWGDDFDPIPKDEDGNAIASPTPADFEANRLWFATRLSPTDGNDSLSTTGGSDRLYGQGGADQLNAGAGDDYASGGSGNDRFAGGDGNDRLYGNDGNDTLSGDGGHDLLSGGGGNDLLFGRQGNDVLIGGDGADSLSGNDGDDLLLGGIVSRSGSSADSSVSGDASDQAMLALLLEWSTLAQLTGVTHTDDGDLDWLFGHTGSDRFFSDGTSRNYDFVAGIDQMGL